MARGGQVKVWIGRDGLVHKYGITLRMQGRLGNAEVDGSLTRDVLLSGRNAVHVKVPEGARKVLE